MIRFNAHYWANRIPTMLLLLVYDRWPIVLLTIRFSPSGRLLFDDYFPVRSAACCLQLLNCCFCTIAGRSDSYDLRSIDRDQMFLFLRCFSRSPSTNLWFSILVDWIQRFTVVDVSFDDRFGPIPFQPSIGQPTINNVSTINCWPIGFDGAVSLSVAYWF